MTKAQTIDRSNTHTISILVANKPGVLVRLSQVFSRRGFNIDSLVVSPTQGEETSRITITAKGDPETLDQIIKQAGKLVDVLHATDHTGENVIDKELALIKVAAPDKTRTPVLQICDHFKAETLDFTSESLVMQVTGSTEKLDALIEMLTPYGIIELVRTGKILMARGKDLT
ncbi:acetolactate synthase small subunit [Planctomycetota bacterium]